MLSILPSTFLGAAFTTGTSYVSPGAKAAKCADGSKAPDETQCGLVAEMIQTKYAWTAGYKDGLAIYNAAYGTKAVFGKTALGEAKLTKTEELDTTPMGCYFAKEANADDIGKVIFNKGKAGAGKAADAAALICCKGDACLKKIEAKAVKFTGASEKSGYQTKGAGSNDAEGNKPTKEQCTVIAKTVNKENAGTQAHQDILGLYRAVFEDKTAVFGEDALKQTSATEKESDDISGGCSIRRAGDNSRRRRLDAKKIGNIVFNKKAGKADPNGAVMGCKAACPAAVDKTVAKAAGDPHFITGHGDKFDFKGENNKMYALFSTNTMALNALFQHVKYTEAGINERVVDGSYMTSAFAVFSTNSGRKVNVEFDATKAVFIKVRVDESDLVMYKAPFAMTVDDVTLTLNQREAVVANAEYRVSLTSKMKRGIQKGTSCATGKCFLDVSLTPLIDADKAKVAPHGLIGQSYDGDDLAVIGKTDEYKGLEVTTTAMGEGAIEGTHTDYVVDDKFSTDFKFSRFGKTEAAPRDVAALTGTKVKREHETDAGTTSVEN